MESETKDGERFLSIELKSRASLRNVTLANGSRDHVLVEATIGELMQATFVEGIILEIVGTKGTLRINIRGNEIGKATEKSSGDS